MTTVLLTNCSIGRMAKCDPLPPPSVRASLRPRISPAVRPHCCTSSTHSASALRSLRSPPASFSVHAAPRQRRSPPSPLSVFTALRLSVSTAALRPRRSPSSLLSVLVALRSRRTPCYSARLSVMATLRPPLSVLSALRPNRAPSACSPPSPLTPCARCRRSALLTPVSRPPQVEIMPCSNHITGISAANVHKVSNMTRGTLKQTLEI